MKDLIKIKLKKFKLKINQDYRILKQNIMYSYKIMRINQRLKREKKNILIKIKKFTVV
jgi:hypothetical protein